MTQQFTHIDETAKALNISTSTLYRLARDGQVPHVRVGKRYLFLIDDIVARMRLGSPAPVQQPKKPAPGVPLPGLTPPSYDALTQKLARAAEALSQVAQQIEAMRRSQHGNA